MAQATTTGTSTSLEDIRGALALKPEEQASSIGFYDGPSYALLRSISKDFASSDIVPERFRGKAANCMIAINMAARMMADPLMIMQNLYIVHGTPGWSSQFLISCFNQCGRFDSIQYSFTGEKGKDSWGCIAWAIDRRTGTKIEGSEVTVQIAKDEGWYGKNGSKWKTMPQQMLMYRAAAWMIRTHAPEIGMGFQTREEIEDAIDLNRQPDGRYAMTTEDLRTEDVGESSKPESAPKKKPTPPPQAAEPTQEPAAEVTGICPHSKTKVRVAVECNKCERAEGCPGLE